MFLSTPYLGLTLSNPFVLGPCPLAADVDAIKRVVDAGASAVVMHSLFEEQLSHAAMSHPKHSDPDPDDRSTPSSMRPTAPKSKFILPSVEYLEQLSELKRSVQVPVIASLNGASEQGWLYYSRQLESAGADALELNVYHLALRADESAADVEQQLLDMVQQLTAAVNIPVAVKLSPFYSAVPHLVGQLVARGARGVVLFNRFFEPDIDVEALALEPKLSLSDPSELLLRLRWTAAISPTLPASASIAVTGGVHTAIDALKAVMAGAHVVQLVSAVLQRGPTVFTELRVGLESWLREHHYPSLQHARGCMSLARCADPTFYQRGNYLKILQSYGRRRRDPA